MTIDATSFHHLVMSARSTRRFDGSRPLDRETLSALVNTVRLAPSAANLQGLRFRLVVDEDEKQALFPCLGWAGYLKAWKGPAEGERPGGYIVIVADEAGQSVWRNWDGGIASQTLVLAAASRGLGACMIGNFRAEKVQQALGGLPGWKPLLVMAFGYPGETIQLEDVDSPDAIRYWRDEAGVHHVPKRKLEDLLI